MPDCDGKRARHYYRDVSALTKTQALIWLHKNDPEYPWTKLTMTREEALEAVRINLHCFGEDHKTIGLRPVEEE